MPRALARTGPDGREDARDGRSRGDEEDHKREMSRTSVVMVTMHENPDYLFEAVKAGAAGYVLKDASGERLLGAVRRTLEGESPLNQELAMRRT